MLTESFADIFVSVFGNAAETAAAYYCFCRIILHKPRLREYIIIIALSLILPINIAIFSFLLIISGTFFSKRPVIKNIIAAAVTETVFQLSFSLWGAVIGVITWFVNVKETPSFGISAMLSGELFSLLTAVFILNKFSGIIPTKYNKRTASTIFLPLPIIFI